jgi:hypothetical protein
MSWTSGQVKLTRATHSDIVAELPMPPSHILQYEDSMPYPNSSMAFENGFDLRVIQSYMAQLYMRKRLNEIHRTLYSPERQFGLPTRTEIEQIERLLLNAQAVPPEFRFDPSDPPAGDILSARLRAKHWGAQNITYRPFIRYILDTNEINQRTQRPPIPVDVAAEAGQTVQEYSLAEVINFAQKGIKALIESTRAFHGMGDDRLIITNVFGTAHA